MTIWLQISSGRGPAECCWVVSRTLSNIIDEATASGLKAKTLELVPGDKPRTLKSALVSLEGKNAEEFTRQWAGTIQWIGQSPFRPKHKRKNWFVGVEIVPFPDEQKFHTAEIRFDAMRASGPGGQHVNKSQTAVRATHISSGLTAVAQEERSQMMNKKLAFARLIKLHEEEQSKQNRSNQKDRWAQHNELERGNPVRVFSGPKFQQQAI